MEIWAAWTVVWLVVLLIAERAGSSAGRWIAKPLASAGFIGVAWAGGATGDAYGVAVLAALVLCFFGDVFLIPDGSERWFQAGLVSFLLGHLGFAVAFLVRGVSPVGAAVAAALAAVPVWLVLRWLRPHLPDAMRVPVHAYVVVISAMVVTAVGATAAGGPPAMAVGAILFYVSDIAVAREQFVARGFSNRLWGLPLYYGGNLVLAYSVAS